MSESAPISRKGLALALLAAAQFIVVLDASIVNVALPSMGRDLDFATEDLSWVVNAYTLVFGGFLLLGGRMADLLGRRRVFVAGLILFSAASLAGGLAQSPGWLVAARAVQGLGAAILSPAALSIITTTFAEGAERNRALGVWGAVAGSGGAAGVLFGGLLTEYAGWEWVLFVNVPIGLAVAFFATRILPESKIDGPRHFDAAGAVTVTAGLSLLVYALVDTVNAGWGSTQTIVLIAISLLLIAGFLVIESRSKSPLVSFGIFRNRTLTGANVVGLLVAMSLFSMFFFVSLYMQNVLGYDALKAGLAYLPLAFGIIVSAGLASVLVTRIGFKPTLIAGLLLTAGGLIWFSQVSVDGEYVSDILPASLLAAFGLGLAFVPMTIAAVSGVSGREAGLASGLINTSQQVGGALGLAILATVANSRTDDVMAAAGGAKAGAPDGADRGLPGRVHGRRGLRHRRRDPRGRADLQQGQPRARRGGAPRRGGGRPGRGLVVPQRRPPHPGDGERLQRQPQPQERFRHRPEALGVDGHVHVGGEDRHEQRDQPPAAPRGGAAVEQRQRAGDLRHAADVDDLGVQRQRLRHRRLVRARLDEVHDPGAEEEQRQRQAAAHQSPTYWRTNSFWALHSSAIGVAVLVDSAIRRPSRVNGGGWTLSPVSGASGPLSSSHPGQRRAS